MNRGKENTNGFVDNDYNPRGVSAHGTGNLYEEPHNDDTKACD